MKLRIFVSYRRSDAAASARQISAALKRRFGDDHVFFDVRDLPLGTAWHADIKQRVCDADVVLVIVGRHWLTAVCERSRGVVEEDVLRTEIETALQSGRLVIPVLVDDAPMPRRDALPRPFKALAALESATLRHSSWDADVNNLIARLERTVARQPVVTVTQVEELARPPSSQPPSSPVAAPAPSAPDAEHFADIIECLEDASLVLMLGPGINATDSPWRQGCGRLPTADELAAALADRFHLPPGDLSRISQHILLRRGQSDLHKVLRELLIRPVCEPTSPHRFLARLPRLLPERHQLIVTTNFDTALERAFDEAHQPFDLTVFMASGEHKGRFVHIPWDKAARPVERPNEYVDFPIDDDGDLQRTVIMKIHGGPLHDGPANGRQLDRNYVITEDDYIGYLSRSTAESLVPTQLLRLLRESHLLFLGYGVRAWSLRVFLQRVWVDERLERSWSIQPTLDRLDRGFWDRLHVERFAYPLSDYVDELERHLAGALAKP
jgi:hypothetical protein